MQETMIITKKFTLYPQGDKTEVNRVYTYLRNGMQVQAQMMNLCATALYSAKMNNMDKEEYKKLKTSYGQIPSEKNKETSAYYGFIEMDKLPKGIAIPGSIPRTVEQKLDKAYKDGLKYGRVSLPTYRADYPMFVQRPLLLPPNDPDRIEYSKSGLFHEYENEEAFYEALKKDDNVKVSIRFANKILFDIVFGNVHKSAELRSVMEKIFKSEYRVCDSSIQVKGNKIYLLMSLKIPCKKNVLDPAVCVGVDLGICQPAVCALNSDLYKREYIGSYDELIAFRLKKNAMYQRLQAQTKNRGGHGRKRKNEKMYRYENYIANYAKTYNHKLAKQIVEFAVKNRAAYINLESLSGIKEPKEGQDEHLKILLRNWSIYDLQNKIEYKAGMAGIQVRYVEAAYTSQICSICGKSGELKNFRTFTCTNPECNCANIYQKFKKQYFVDFNAARNIAMSTDFVERTKKAQKKKEKEQKSA